MPKALQHSIWSVLDAALYPVFYLATVPVLIHSFGAVLFGLWIILNTLITIFQLFNLNLGIAAMQKVSAELARNDKNAAADIINSLIFITFFLFLFAAAAGFFLAETAIDFGWWGIRELAQTNVSLCIFLASIIAGLKYFDQIFQSILKAKEEFRRTAILNIINRFGLLFINLFMAVSAFSIHQILFANILFSLVYLFVQFFSLKRVFIFYKLRKVLSKNNLKALLRFSKWPWLQSLIVVLTFQTDRLWVSAFAGLEEVSAYGLVSTMFNHIHIIFTAMAIWMLPRISAMISKNQNPKALYTAVRGGLLSVVMVSLLVFYVLSPYILPVWIGEKDYLEMQDYVKAFIAFEIVFAHTILPIIYLNASGKEKLATYITAMYCGVCYLCMMLGLWLFKSPVALVEGMTLSLCITIPAVNIITQKIMSGAFAMKQFLMEILTVYAAILLLYCSNPFLFTGLIFVIAFLLWRFYLPELFNKFLWKPASI